MEAFFTWCNNSANEVYLKLDEKKDKDFSKGQSKSVSKMKKVEMNHLISKRLDWTKWALMR